MPSRNITSFLKRCIYLYIYVKLWLVKRRKTKQNRFDVYICDPGIDDPQLRGSLAAKTDWLLATPNLKRKENILLAGSNTWGSGIRLEMKWRPNEELKLSTLITKFTLECGSDKPIYDYEEVWTQSVDFSQYQRQEQYIQQYTGQNIKLEVISPYRSYRIFFSGFMRDRETKQLVYIRFRSIITNSGKIYDFKEQYDTEYMASQLARKRFNCGRIKALHELALQDRHEHTVQFRCSYTLMGNSEIGWKEEKLFCWGFHARHFINKDFNETQRPCKRILAYFSNGISFHLGACELEDDPNQRIEFGYSCPRYSATYPIQKLDRINWAQIEPSRTPNHIEFILKCDNVEIHVKSANDGLKDSIQESAFFDLIANGKKGRGLILIDDIAKNENDQHLVERNVHDYIDRVHHQQKLIDLTYLEMKWNKKQFEKKRPVVVSLDDKSCQYSSLCGAKAASLAQLLHFQLKLASKQDSGTIFKVPNGIVLTRYAYDSILELNPELRQEERRLASVVCQGNQYDIKQESERFQRMFLPSTRTSDAVSRITLKIPEQLLNELERLMLITFKMNTINDTDKSFAVRSSSWGEDEDNMSAAGQLTTLLSVQGFNQLRDAIMICFGSKYSTTNLEYKRQHGLPIDMPMAIVIQEMVDCDKAGVMFTCDPTNGDERQLLITANYGLGESVVSAAADPDSILVAIEVDNNDPNDILKRRANHIEKIKVGAKKTIMTSESIRHKQSEEYNLCGSIFDENNNSILSQDASKCCLKESEIFRLANCGLRLNHYFRCARDIEWGMKGGELFLFQSRPITGLDTMNDFEMLHEFSYGLPAEKEWLTRANLGEVLPLAATPLMITYAFRFWDIFASNHFMKMRLIQPGCWFSERISDLAFVGYFGFFFLRMNKMFCFESSGEKDRPLTARAMEIGLFGHEVNDQELSRAACELSEKAPWYSQLFITYHSFVYRWFPHWVVSETKKKLCKLRDVLLNGAPARTTSMEDLYKLLGITLSRSFSSWSVHLMATTISPEYNHKLTSILSRYIDEPSELYSCFSKLLSSQTGEVFSAGVPRQIDNMVKVLRDTKQVENFLSTNDKEALAYVNQNEELSKLYNKFIDDFGHRSYNEFEIASERWRENPKYVINMIKQSCQEKKLTNSAKTSRFTTTASRKNGSKLLGEMGIHLGLIDRLWLDYFILPKCHQFVDVRERTKDLLIYNYESIRLVVCLVAKQMRLRGCIPDEDIIFYMSYEELMRIAKQTVPGIVAQAQKRRRFFKTLNRWKFNEIVQGHDFLPCHLMVDSKEAQKEKERLQLAPKIPGTPASSGQIQGRVCIVNEYKELNRVEPGDILVTYSTDIAFSPVFPIIGGIVTEIGGLISHGAVIAREYGLPSLIGVSNVTSILKDGEQIILDANSGHILRLDLTS